MVEHNIPITKESLEASALVARDVASFLNTHKDKDKLNIYYVIVSLLVNLMMVSREATKKSNEKATEDELDVAATNALIHFTKEVAANYAMNINLDKQSKNSEGIQ